MTTLFCDYWKLEWHWKVSFWLVFALPSITASPQLSDQDSGTLQPMGVYNHLSLLCSCDHHLRDKQTQWKKIELKLCVTVMWSLAKWSQRKQGCHVCHGPVISCLWPCCLVPELLVPMVAVKQGLPVKALCELGFLIKDRVIILQFEKERRK